MKIVLLSSAILAATLPGCEIGFKDLQIIRLRSLRGSGTSASEQRTVPAFHTIEFRGAGDVEIAVGGKHELSITTDDNLLTNVETEVKGDVLVIDTRENYKSKLGLKVKVALPELKRVGVSGSSDVNITGLKGEEFELNIAGSGDVVAEGEAKSIKVKIAGSGDIDFYKVAAEDVEISIAGSGNARVNVTKELVAKISGSGDIQYAGSPESITKQVSGSGNIRRRD